MLSCVRLPPQSRPTVFQADEVVVIKFFEPTRFPYSVPRAIAAYSDCPAILLVCLLPPLSYLN